MIGSVLDKYEVLQKLGEGATATVYRGRHLTIGRDVAIKVLHPHLSASSRYRERFNREARAVGRLAHQNIVSILDYSGQNAEECYIVTELVDGVTLLELIQQRGRLPSEIAALVGADLASALAFAHREGIIHRDIKPENVMIRRDGRVKLMDFGIARVLDESSITLDGSLLGSPAYMSPQQALDEPLDGRTDIFSLGTVMFHAVTGHVPFSGSNASVILRNIIEANRPEVLELAPQASPAITAVIDRLLQPRAEDRYATADDASAALIASLDEVRLSANHPTINLRAYVVDAVACEEHLAAILRPTLLEVGKERLTRGDTLGALQLFNRLLAIDEDNAEVIALIQSLHQSPPAMPRRMRAIIPALALLFLAALVGGGWWAWSRGELPPPKAHLASKDKPTVESAAVSLVSPVGPAVVALPPVAPASNAVGAATMPEPAAPVEAPQDPGDTPIRPPAGAPLPMRLPGGIRVPTQGVAAPAPAALKPAQLVLTLTEATFADVWVDGQKVGARAGGPIDTWVGTEDNPVELVPGKRIIEVGNKYAETWREEVQASEGEIIRRTPVLRRKKVTYNVNPRIPIACTLTVDGVYYDRSRTLELRDPNPGTRAAFECPAPLGKFEVDLPMSEPGGTAMLPTHMPNLAEDP
ncbi:MAG: protein kinase [Pseudomonadota bacterium]|nr:protein kinase [Pseudomonadota bacterium]